MASAVQPSEYVEELATILKEFAAIPGLRLTEADIRSRWWLTEAESGTILEYPTHQHWPDRPRLSRAVLPSQSFRVADWFEQQAQPPRPLGPPWSERVLVAAANRPDMESIRIR